MAESDGPHAPDEGGDAPVAGWRFRVGVALIATGFLSPLGSLLLPFTDLSTAVKATLSGILLAGIPELLTVAAVAVMGKSGFVYVKGRVMALLRRCAPPKEVGPIRYYIGLTMFLIPGIYAWVTMYAPPELMPGFPEYRLHMGLAIDFLFVVSFFVLGGDFWDKLRALFLHRAKAQPMGGS